jgi:membrane-bound serine protease (ClpP class)
LSKNKGFFVLLTMLLFLPVFSTSAGLQAAEQGEDKLVYVIPIENEVERGLEAFLVRSTNEAIENGANHIIFEIDTPGGRVDAAGQIGKLFQGLDIPTTAFIVNQALSAGSYIALNSDTIYMKPNATMGASGVITSDGNAADKKAQSAWIAAMEGAAESNGRDPLYAKAMADESIDLPELGAPKGKFLTLTPNDAVEVGYAEGVVKNRVELLAALGLSGATIQETDVSFAEGIARFVTNPIVIPILLSVASLGLIVELYTPGFGVAGSMGLVALGLFFYGHFIAGLAGAEAITLFIIGVGCIIAEFFVASSILGIIGAGSIIVSLFLAGYDLTQMAISISIACIVAILGAIILFKWIGTERGILNKVILRDRTTTELGYVSVINRDDLVGKIGMTATGLRPAGRMILDDEWLDVVSEGAFIEKDQKVKIIQVEGIRIVVRKVN